MRPAYRAGPRAPASTPRSSRYLVFLAFPFLWLISTAFKSPRELGSLHPTWIPEDPTLDNFRQAFDEQPLLRAAVNSLHRRARRRADRRRRSRPRMAYVMARHRGRARHGPPPAGSWSARRSRSCW